MKMRFTVLFAFFSLNTFLSSVSLQAFGPEDIKDVVVVGGGGLSGLAAAHKLT